MFTLPNAAHEEIALVSRAAAVSRSWEICKSILYRISQGCIIYLEPHAYGEWLLDRQAQGESMARERDQPDSARIRPPRR